MTESDYQTFLEEIRKEFPDFKMAKKSDSVRMKLINIFLLIITLGQMRSFMTRFLTTNGTTIYTPLNWQIRSPRRRIVSLRHERIHMRQKRRLGIKFTIAYLFLPLPTIFAYCRKVFEQQAYEETLKAIAELYGTEFLDPNIHPELKESVVKNFTGPRYFWTWPWKNSIEKWYDRVVEQN